MELLDRVYQIIYWSVNKKLDRGRTTIWTLNYLLFPLLSGILVFVISLLFNLLTIKISLAIIILVGIVVSFFLSEKLIGSYFNYNYQLQIINKYSKPGFYRYFKMAFIVIFPLVLMLLFFILAGILYNK